MITATCLAPEPDDPADRLGRLQAYLQHDPANRALLAETCDAAIAAGQHEFAQGLLDAARALGLGQDEPAWTFRHARLCIATRDLPQAEKLLDQLRRLMGEQPAVAHDLAWVAFLRGDLSRCRALLEPWLDIDDDALVGDAQTIAALQVLWLRATHALRLVDAAWTWAWARHLAGRLQPAAQGVASLVAIDADRFEEARVWSELALQAPTPSPEALVARASVALAQAQTELATSLLERALQTNPHDGRIWLTLGLTSLREGRAARAQQQLERAAHALGVHIGAWHALGWARLVQRDLSGGRAAFERALAIDPSFAETHGAIGLVLALAGEKAQAEYHLSVCDRLDRRNVTGAYARAWLDGQTQDPSRLQGLAARLFDRPGFFAGRLSESVPALSA